MADQMPPDMKDKILHSVLTKGGLVIMASDMMGPERQKLQALAFWMLAGLGYLSKLRG